MDDNKKIATGDIVWVKLGNCWWPGEVCDDSDLAKDIFKGVRKRPLYIVRFFKETNYEFVKNINNICKYNDSRKNTFIKKGLDLVRANRKYMEKFPTDVAHAERLTGGDENITSSEQFSPVKKVSYASIFGNDSSAKKKKGQGKEDGEKEKKSTPVRNSAGRKPKASSTIQSTTPAKDNMKIFNLAYENPRIVPLKQPVDAYNCKICSFSTSRCNIMIMHMKTHTTTSPTKDAAEKKQPEPAKDLYVPSANTSTETIETEDGNETEKDTTDEESKPVVIIEPPKKRKTPKKPGLKHLILADWSEDDEEEETVTKSTTSADITADTPRRISDIQTSTDNHEDNSGANSAEKTASTVTKIRNIPKKDRRDIILSEFEPMQNLNIESEKSPSETVAAELCEKPPTNDEIVVETEVIEEKINSIETSVTMNQDAELHDDPNEKSPTSTPKGTPPKTLSCFDFKDDDEDVTDDFLSSLSKLKEKYLSPEKKLSQEDVCPQAQDENKEKEAKDNQLASDIENLLNATVTPALSDVVGESVSHDVRALPPKERGKRIFKSRNRPLSDPERERQSSTESPQKAANDPEFFNESICDVVALVESKDTSTSERKSITEDETYDLTVASQQKDPSNETLQTVVADGEEHAETNELHVEEDSFVGDNQPKEINETVCMDDNESIDSTAVEASDGNSNHMMTDNEHDLNALAAAETLISIPSKLQAENLVESVENNEQYPKDDEPVEIAQNKCELSPVEMENQTNESQQIVNTPEIEESVVANAEGEIPPPTEEKQVSNEESVTIEITARNEDHQVIENDTAIEEPSIGRRTRHSSRNKRIRSKQISPTNDAENQILITDIQSPIEEPQEKPSTVDETPMAVAEPQLEAQPTVAIEGEFTTANETELIEDQKPSTVDETLVAVAEPQLEAQPIVAIEGEAKAANETELIEDQVASPAEKSKRHKRKKHKKSSRRENKRLHIENSEETSLSADNNTPTLTETAEQTQPESDGKEYIEQININVGKDIESENALTVNETVEAHVESPLCIDESKQVDLDLEKLDLDQLQEQTDQSIPELRKDESNATFEEIKSEKTVPAEDFEIESQVNKNNIETVDSFSENSEVKTVKEVVSEAVQSELEQKDIPPAILLLEEMVAESHENVSRTECVPETQEHLNVFDIPNLNENDDQANNGESINEYHVDEKQEEHEMNAAEQILDEISNLTSSIDIILNAERAEDEQLCLDEVVQEEPGKSIEDETPKNVIINDSTDELTVATVTENLQTIEKIAIEFDENKKQCGTETQSSSSDTSNVADVGTRKRKSHLKYTPPKQWMGRKSIEEAVESQGTSGAEIMEPSSATVTMGVTVSSDPKSQLNLENKDTVPDVHSDRPNEPTEQSINIVSDVMLNPLDKTTEVDTTVTSKTDAIQEQTRKPLTLNSFSFDHDPLDSSISQPSYINQIRELMSSKNRKHAEGKHQSDKSHTSKPTTSPSGESKMSSKRRLSKLKEQTPKPLLTTSEDIQERIKVYSFDDQADNFEAPKKAKYSTTKENKNEKHSPKSETKGNISSEITRTHTSSSEKSKHSRSRQINLQNVSDVRIPKFPKIDRSKRPHLESGESTKVETFENDRKKNTYDLTPDMLDEPAASVHMTKSETVSNSGTPHLGNIMSTGVVQVSSHSLQQYSTNLPTTSTSHASSLGSSAKRKPSRTTSTQSRKAKQQQQSSQVPFQMPMPTQNMYDPYLLQHNQDLNAQYTMDVQIPSTDKQSRSHASNIDGSQIQMNTDRRGHVISAQTVVMPTPATPNRPAIKTCASDPLFITSKGNVIPSSPISSTYSSATSTAQAVTHFSQSNVRDASSQLTPGSRNKRVSSRSHSEIARDSNQSKSSCNLAEIKRLDQKPLGKVLTAHGFNELEMVDQRLMQGKMSVREGNVAMDLPVLVPIGDSHAATRMPVKVPLPHSTKDVTATADAARVSNQTRNSSGNSVQQQSNFMAGNTNFEATGSHLMRDNTGNGAEAMFLPSQPPKLQPTPHHQRVPQNQRQQQSQYQLNQSSHDHQPPGLPQNRLSTSQHAKIYQQPIQTEQSVETMRQTQGKRRKAEHDHSGGVAHPKQPKSQQMDMQQKQMKLHQETQPPKLAQIQQPYKVQTHEQQTHQTLHQSQVQHHQVEQERQQLHMNQQLHHEQPLSQEEQLQLHLQQELQLQQGQQLQLEQHLHQQQHELALQQHDQQEIVIQGDNDEGIIGNQLLVQDGNNAFFLDLKNIVALMNNEEGEITGVQLASGETLFVTQSIEDGDVPAELENQTIQLDGRHLLLTDSGALEDGIEVPGQDILVESIEREVYQDGQLIRNVLQIETSEGIKLVESPYHLISAAKAAATNETNAIMPPIMSALEIPSSKSELVINTKPNESGLIGQNLDDSLAVIGVTSQSSSAVRSSLDLPITITNPAIAPKTSNSMNVGSIYGAGMQSQNEMSPNLSSQDPSQLGYDLFSQSSNNSQHHGANIFNTDGTYKSTDAHSTQLPPGMDDQCLNEIILQSTATAGTANDSGAMLQQSNEIFIGGEQVCDQYAVVENQATNDAYSNQTR